ncbi:WhiB family transcriptional regulator [Micromonospora sp. H33]|uniref:WhiB family transcriptional regulator n=1 Tax=Micromonospora sp. H33 TaxID=3452215 RepID=UPI003F8966E8
MPTSKRPAADLLYPLLAAVGVPPQGGACGRSAPAFPDGSTQQAVFDGDVEDPALLAAARAVCASCPSLEACTVYAAESLDKTTFLAGLTATEREAFRRRSERTLHRRTVVERMRAENITASEISFYTQYPMRSVELDMAGLAAG